MMSNPSGDSVISGLPQAQVLTGAEVIPVSQLISGKLTTVQLNITSLSGQVPPLASFQQTGPGTKVRTVTGKLQDIYSVADLTGNDPSGAGDSSTAFTAAALLSSTITVPDGTWKIGSTITSSTTAWQVSPNAKFTGSGTINLNRGFFSDVGNYPQVWRFPDRVRIGHNKALFGDLQYLGSPTYQIPFFGWAERESSNHTVSAGRMAVTGVTQQSLIAPVTQSSFTASISGTTLTVTAVASGTLQIFQYINGTGVPANLYIASLGTGTGGTGTYNLQVSGGTVTSRAMTAYYQPNGIGVSGFCLNDDTTYGSFGWGAYAECFRVQGAQASYGMELDIGEGSTGGTLNNPYIHGGNATIGILLNSGGSAGPYVSPASAGLVIGSNLGTFNAGIVINSNAIASNGGVYDAITMAQYHNLKWYSDSTHVAAVIRSEMTIAGVAKNFLFEDTAVYLGDANNNTAFIFDTSQGSNDGFQFTTFATGQNKVRLAATGADTNIDVQVTPKGAGNFLVTSFAKVFATKATALSLTNNAATVISGWVTTFDANSNFTAATGIFVAPATGYYMVSAQVVTATAAIAAGTVVSLTILNNGANAAAGETSYPTASGANSPMCVQATALLSVTSGQQIKINVFQNSGGAVNTTTGAAATYLSIVQVA